MQVIPVIDLKGDKVVHGVAGRRDEYEPIKSDLVSSALPAPVADALVQKVGASQAYLREIIQATTVAPSKRKAPAKNQ